MTMGERMERLSGIIARVEKLEQLVARDEGAMLQVWGKGQAAPRAAPRSREAYAHLQTWLAQRGARRPGDHAVDALCGRRAAHAAAPVGNLSLVRGAQVCSAVCSAACQTPRLSAFCRHGTGQAQKALGHKHLEITALHYMLDELQVGLTEGLF